MKATFVALLLIGFLGCVRKNDPEHGYRRLMSAITLSNLTTCEKLLPDGSTCYTIRENGKVICAPTRDGAAEAAGEWIEHNITQQPVQIMPPKH